MKVFVKKGDYEPPLAGIIVTVVFLSFSLYALYSFLNTDDILKFIEGFGMFIPFALIFFCFGMLFLFYMIKPCGKFNGKLTYKKFEEYNGRNILVMKFKVLGNNSSIYHEYRCFTYNDNDLGVGRCYELFVKEYNWKIKKVGNEIKEEVVQENVSDDEAFNPKDVGFNSVFAAVVIIFSALLFFSIYGLFKYPEYWYAYVGVILFFAVPAILYYNEYRKNK